MPVRCKSGDDDRVTSVMDGASLERAERPSPADAFQRYVVPEIPSLLRVGRTLTRDPDDAEDLVQDTLLRAYRSMSTFDGMHPRAWLFTILRHTHINRNRRRRPELLENPDDVDAVPEARPSDPAELTERAAFRDAVIEAIRALPIKMRVVVELVDLESFSYAEAATALGVPIGTVMSRLHRGRRRIREQLTASGLDNGRSGSR